MLQAEYDENPKVTAKKLEQHLVETFPDNEEWRHRTVDIQTCLDKYWKELQKLRQTGGPRGCAAVVCTLERHTPCGRLGRTWCSATACWSRRQAEVHACFSVPSLRMTCRFP